MLGIVIFFIATMAATDDFDFTLTMDRPQAESAFQRCLLHPVMTNRTDIQSSRTFPHNVDAVPYTPLDDNTMGGATRSQVRAMSATDDGNSTDDIEGEGCHRFLDVAGAVVACDGTTLQAKGINRLSRSAQLSMDEAGPDHVIQTKWPSADALVAPGELDRLRGEDWGRRLLQNLGEWDTILADDAVVDQLGGACILCGMWCGRMQEYTLHVQHHHSAVYQYMSPISQQIVKKLTYQSDNEHACGICHIHYKSMHTCKVASQLALLVGLTQAPAALHTCMLCQEELDSLTELQMHLLQAHGMKTIVWNQSRDALRGEPQCRHCLQRYNTMNGLKQHIQNGRCMVFDGNARPQAPEVDEQLFAAFWSGQIRSRLEDADTRLRLAHICQVCERQYDRSADLMVHLQQAHADLYHRSMRLQKWLIHRLYGQLGCLCSPVVENESPEHVCPIFVQMAITHTKYRIELYGKDHDDLPPHAAILVPGWFTEEWVAALIDRSIP
eukprot:Skav202610  [mRNA]  locus=scaffold2348:196242:201056:+ [translate_table: standard]